MASSAMLRQGSDSSFLNSRYFLLMQGFLCLVAMQFCRVVEAINIQLLMKKSLQIIQKSMTEHVQKNLIFN